MQEIRVKYFSDKIEKLAYIEGKSDWIDLRSAIDVKLKAGEFKIIPLGVGMKLPEGYEAHIVPRSSTFNETYCGDNDQWGMAVYAVRDTEIHVNDRICQFRIMEHQPALVFEETDRLEDKSRGGFGSTGTA